MKNHTLLETLKNLDDAIGVSGDEEKVAKVLKEEAEGLYDEYFEDGLGNQYFVKYGRNRDKKILLCAHMDEIGYIVNHIEPNGLVRFLPVGFHDDRTAVNQDLVIITDEGREVRGVTGSKPFHALSEEEQAKITKIPDLFMDLGTASREETLALGVQVGNYAGFARKGGLLNEGKIYTGKSLDNRAGCAILVETLRRLKGLELEPTIYFVGTVMEEVGMRGGGVAASNVKPELALALDVALAGDFPGLEEKDCNVMLGKGPAILYYDWDPVLGQVGNNVPRKLTNRMIAVAEKHGIPYQREVMMGGGTDAWSASISGLGCLAGGIGIPSRYIHTPVSTIHIDDLKYAVDFVVAYLKEY